MAIRDIYLLQCSNGFHLNPRQEVSVDLALYKVPVEPRTLISGQVIGSCGPLLGATVKVFSMDYTPLLHAVTDAEGRFQFRNMLYPGNYRLIATADGYSVSSNYMVFLEPKNPVNVIVKLKVSDLVNHATIYGIVRDNNSGFGLCNAVIRVYNDCNFEKIEAVSRSNEDGEYMIYGLDPGKYRITASKTGFVFQQPVFFECFPNETLPLDLFLYEDIRLRNGTVTGKIEHNGMAVPGAAVALYRVENNRHTLIAVKKTNDEGVYLFGDVQPGAYLIKAKLEGQTEISHETDVS